VRIKEFAIIRYGPLPDTERILLNNFNLFFGKNEDGKTLTIDALVKLLLGRNIRDFERIDRVEEIPEGYVIILDDKGKEIKLPEKGNLTKAIDLTPSECRNIFIVRNSDLSIARDIAQESDFYTNVTDRLTGLRTKAISSIKRKLQDLGKLTRAESGAELSDKKDFGNIKSRLSKASKLIEKINSLQEKIEEEKFDALEEESVKQREEIEVISQEMKSLEEARKREKYEKGKEALDKLKEALERYKQLEIYSDDEERLWRDYEKEVKTSAEQRENLLTMLKEKEKELKGKGEKLSEAERDFRVFNERRKKLDDEVKPDLKNYEMEVGKVKSEETKNRFYKVPAIISVVLLSISMLGVIINPSPILYGLLTAFLISTGILAVLRFSFTQRKAHLTAVFGRIRLATSKLELGAEKPEEIYANIQRFEEKYSQKVEELEEVRTGKKVLETNIKNLKEEISGIEKKIRDTKDKVDELRKKSKVDSLQEYANKLKLNQVYEKSIGEQKSILKNIFEKKSEISEENISFWNEEITNLEEHKDKAKGMKYSESAVSGLEEKRHNLEEGLKEINNKRLSIQREMEEVQREVNEILRLEEELECKTSVDLKAVKDSLQGFIDKNESNRNNVLEVMKIFEEIETEEKEKVSELFGKESPISRYFSEITESLYNEVIFNQETGKIEVKYGDGKTLGAEKLSGGTYDQLYFSIRLALGEKLLKGKKGFFIMDDPFVKADLDRVQRQIEMLKKISKLGWQVIYFSAKKEIKDVLKEDIDHSAVNYIQLQGVFP